MEEDRCPVCGCTDMKLKDGYYYCLECGTQDVNFRETLIEKTIYNDAVLLASKKKIHKTKKVEMSTEWYKWHAYNFMLCGLADEMLALGAQPEFKARLLWIWSRYIKYYQEKDDTVKERRASGMDFYEDSSNSEDETTRKKYCKFYDTHPLTVSVLLSMIVIALNMINSDMLLSDVLRFRIENRISSISLLKYVPKDIKFKITDWHKSFQRSRVKTIHKNGLGVTSMNLFDRLELKTHWIPDLRKIVNKFVTELCLPNDFKLLLYSLMKAVPYRQLHVLEWDGKRKMPDYDGLVAAFVMIALKICFGLDDHYEVKLSDAVCKINEDNNYVKSYKFDMYSEDTSRLFSFNEWITYLQFRDLMLRQYSLFVSDCEPQKYNEDYVLVTQKKIELQPDAAKAKMIDQITWEFVKKLTTFNPELERHNNEFPVTLTPMSTYTDILASKLEDPDLRLLLCEDFTKYSLKYAAIDFDLKDSEDANIVEGVNEIDKIHIEDLVWDCELVNYEIDLVYVRDCQNKYWMTTNPPETKHITKFDDNYSNVCDSNEDSVPNNPETHSEPVTKEESDILDDDSTGNIFDDNFYDSNDYDYNYNDAYDNFDNMDFTQYNIDTSIIKDEDGASLTPPGLNGESSVPVVVDRDAVIKELVLKACKKYKIAVPKQFQTSVTQKRRKRNSKEAVEVKRRRVNNGFAQDEINKIIEMCQNNFSCLMTDQVNNPSGLGLQLEAENESKDEISAINASENMFNHNLSENQDQEQDDLDVNDGEILPKINDSKFDEEIYDVKQLFLKYKNIEDEEVEMEAETCLKNDPEFEKLLARAIDAELGNLNDKKEEEEVETHREKCKQSKKPKKSRCEKLITNRSLRNFGYWCRRYPAANLKQQLECTISFSKELAQNYPKSYHFLLACCSIISRTSMIQIYYIISKLEYYISSRSPLIR